MALSKDQLRRIYNVPDSTEEADPSVIARQPFHEAAAKWYVKWFTFLQLIVSIFSFVVILLPVFIKPWRVLIQSTPFLAQIFHTYASLSGFSIIVLCISVLLAFSSAFLMLKIHDGGKAPAVPYYAVIILELYPKTKMAEIGYWWKVVIPIWLVIFVYPLFFGIMAYFLLIWTHIQHVNGG